jgi:hypothetical protein
MRVIRNTLVAVATAATLSACAPVTGQAEFGAPESQTTLVVENNNWSDMVIYLARGASRARLGSVTSMGTAKFRISDAMAGGGYGEVRIIADPIGSDRTYTSPVINIVPGSQVELYLQNNIQVSSFSVY